MGTSTIRFFSYKHLPANMQAMSRLFCDLANDLEGSVPDSPEKSAGMRKLLEAKDCFVRATLPELPEAK